MTRAPLRHRIVWPLALTMAAVSGVVAPGTGVAAPDAPTVEIGASKVFTPDSVTIKPGEVTFVVKNADALEHWFAILDAQGNEVADVSPKSEVTCVWQGKAVDCGPTIACGETARVTFKLSAGQYTYICFPHADAAAARYGYTMIGTLTVRD